ARYLEHRFYPSGEPPVRRCRRDNMICSMSSMIVGTGWQRGRTLRFARRSSPDSCLRETAVQAAAIKSVMRQRSITPDQGVLVMEWMDARPVVPGYYWVRFTDDRTPKQTIGEVAEVPGNGSRQLVVILLGDDEILELDDSFFDRALFAGPMEPPSME
ncbi:hypothetical protein PQQ76_43055, partial [Paraburkholderia sediminicola]